jgi:hypothetical protein
LRKLNIIQLLCTLEKKLQFHTFKNLFWDGPVDSNGAAQERLGIGLQNGLGGVVGLVVLNEGAAHHLSVRLLENVHLRQLPVFGEGLSYAVLCRLV